MATSSADEQTTLKRRRISDSGSEETSDGGFKIKKSEVTDEVDLESRPKSAGCSRDEMMGEEKAEKIRASRGNYDVEVSCTGERGLHQSLICCKKNTDHKNFIPVKYFNIEHLPLRYRDNVLTHYVRVAADMTCRLLVSRISDDRPDTWHGSDEPFPLSAYRGETNSVMTGTGWLSGVEMLCEDEQCPCVKCFRLGRKSEKVRGVVCITTASHVVCDDEEARHTKCEFFYDSPETDTCINKVLTLTRLTTKSKGYDSQVDIKGDITTLLYYTHDEELLDRFIEMYNRWHKIHTRVYQKYFPSRPTSLDLVDFCLRWGPKGGEKNHSRCQTEDKVGTNVNHDLCIIVSHPHGCSKVVSVGAWTHRDVVKENNRVRVSYRYNTPTCPGSSGAPVFTLYKDNALPYLDYDTLKLNKKTPTHSGGVPGNDNRSGSRTISP